MAENPSKARVRSLGAVQRSLQIAFFGLNSPRMEQWLSWLATTGAVAPFVGLFGTVWGNHGRVSWPGYGRHGLVAQRGARYLRSSNHDGGRVCLPPFRRSSPTTSFCNA